LWHIRGAVSGEYFHRAYKRFAINDLDVLQRNGGVRA
jgi:hypothetical protein